MKALPLNVVIDDDPDTILEWSVQKKEMLYDLGVQAAQYLLDDQQLEEQIIVQFMLDLDDEPYADVILHRENATQSLSEAIAYYVEEELYEKAAIAKNLLTQLEYKAK